MKTKRILTSQALPGMVIADDVYSSGGQLIIGKYSKLTLRAITRLKFYSISDIRIILEPVLEDEEAVLAAKSYSDQIKITPEYKQFNNGFNNTVVSLKNSLQSFIENKITDEDVDGLLSKTDEILSKTRNGIHVLHMLQCMRDYDDLTYAHSLNVSLICNVMGHWLHFSKEDINTLTMAGLLHDIGKLLMPKEIITKPGSLTPEEYEIIKTHPTLGYNSIKDQNINQHVKNATLMHHETCDGAGYPNKLKAAQIDSFSKIVTIADIYDAMTSNRVYRGPICPFDVISIFQSEGLQKYEPKYLLVFMEEMMDTYVNCRVRLNNGLVGEVIMTNKYALSKPVVKVGNTFIDLSVEKELTITNII